MDTKLKLFWVLGVFLAFCMLVTGCPATETWEDAVDTTLTSVRADGVTATLGTPGDTPEEATPGFFTFKSKDTEDGKKIITVANLTAFPKDTENAVVNYSLTSSISDTGTFSPTSPKKLTDGQFLWIQVTLGNSMSYYVIEIIITEDFSILHHPVSRNYISGSTIQPLTVRMMEPNDYTYQWFSNGSYSNKNGTPISGGTNASFTPGDSADGTYYYYVTVSLRAANLSSNPAQIRISESAAALADTAFEISDTRLNYVRGIGGTGSFMFRTGDNADASPDADVEYINQLFGEIGCNVLRIMVQDDYLSYINNEVQSRNKDVFFHNARRNFFAVIRRANEYGGYVLANPWTAPQSMKVTTDGGNTPSPTAAGGYLRRSSQTYVDYAEHLKDFLKWLNLNDAPIFALGILNEPDFGGGANYEGMGMSATTTREWFQTVGNFTTQKVSNRAGAGTTTSIFVDDIIPGYGGGKSTHHVLAMSGDSMGNVAGYMNPQITDPIANNRIELIGRHYYSDSSRYTELAGNKATAWKDRPQTGFAAPYESVVLSSSPQMYAPGSTVGNIKREIWQTEHDFNYWSNSTQPPSGNVQEYWNSAFAALNDIDWTLRVAGESVFIWWYSSSYSGFVTSYQPAGFVPRTITPRGRAAAHYARYVGETWFLPMTRTRGNIAFNQTGATGADSEFNAGATDPKISAFEDVNGKFISIVMYTPSKSTSNTVDGAIPRNFGAGGTSGNNDPTVGSTNVGRIEVKLPEGFTAVSATAMRSYGNALATGQSWDEGVQTGSPRYWIDEPVILSADGKFVEVTLPGGNIISIKVMGEWSSSYLTANPRHFESRPQWKGRL